MRSILWGLGAVLVLASACGDGSTSATQSEAGIVVRPGESIQAAVDAADPGDTVRVMPGDYVESHGDLSAVRVTKSLKLIAESTADAPVRIRPGPGQRNGILIEPENPGDPWVDGIEIKGFTVEGFSGMGIWTRFVENFVIENNVSINNEVNGIWPTLSANGEVRNNVSYGSLDTALWVEASENVRVVGNELYRSPTGLEVTVSNDVHMEGNDVHDNVVGVGLYHPEAAGLPADDWPSESFRNWTLVNNRVYDNNLPNPATSGLVGLLPPGIGVLVVGSDDIEIRDNEVTGNDFFGLILVDWCLAVGCEDGPPFPADSGPDDNRIIDNRITQNGVAPPPHELEALAADLVVLGGSNNCASGNEWETTTGAEALTPCS